MPIELGSAEVKKSGWIIQVQGKNMKVPMYVIQKKRGGCLVIGNRQGMAKIYVRKAAVEKLVADINGKGALEARMIPTSEPGVVVDLKKHRDALDTAKEAERKYQKVSPKTQSPSIT